VADVPSGLSLTPLKKETEEEEGGEEEEEEERGEGIGGGGGGGGNCYSIMTTVNKSYCTTEIN
jgi:hypothetical protein